MDIRELAQQSWKTSEEHGFHEDVTDTPDTDILKITLMVEELMEAFGEIRDGRQPTEQYRKCKKCGKEMAESLWFAREGMPHLPPGSQGSMCDGEMKPEGVPSEIADVIIRALDYCMIRDIDIVSAINIKARYNKGRPYKHGRKF